jgi:hypothetical protein
MARAAARVGRGRLGRAPSGCATAERLDSLSVADARYPDGVRGWHDPRSRSGGSGTGRRGRAPGHIRTVRADFSAHDSSISQRRGHQRRTRTRVISSVAGSRRTTTLMLPPTRGPRSGPKTVSHPAHRPRPSTLEIKYCPLIHLMMCYTNPLKSHAERVRPQFLSLRQEALSGHSFSAPDQRSETRRMWPFLANCPNHEDRLESPLWAVFRLSRPSFSEATEPRPFWYGC